MSSITDPAKLKVVELRAELSKRGLDSKGNKPALVKRLKDALEEELKVEIADTSIADTSTEDLDSSQSQEQTTVEETKVPDKEPEPEVLECSLPVDSAPKDEPKTAPPVEEMEAEETKPADPEESEVPHLETPPAEEKEEPVSEEPTENGDQEETKSRRSRWGKESEAEQNDVQPENEQPEPVEATKPESEGEPKGEKRRRSSPSPERSQRRRSKSPIKEDEPPIDKDKVQLSWYDSDLHLQLDKESFLSAKPYHEGAFGFAWAGVRATHGANSGKVCFEVKITEELKWEDFSKYYEKSRRDQHKSDPKHKSDQDKKKSDQETKKDESVNKDETQPENGDSTKPDAPESADDKPMEVDEATPETEAVEEKKSETEAVETAESKPEVVEPIPDVAESKPEAEEKMDTAEEKTEIPEEETEPAKGEPVEEKAEISEEKTETAEEKTETSEEKAESAEEKTEEASVAEEKEPSEPIPTHLFRVGWSILNTELQLGENKFSYGYESTGKFVTGKEFVDYGITFGVGDVITSFLSIDDEKLRITYAVNGQEQPEAVTLQKSELPEDFVFFPHVLSRNYAFEFNLGSKEEAWFPLPESCSDYQFLDKIENKIAGPVRPETRTECEVILMCGLPAAGKTHWVQEYVQSNPDKRYTLLGNTQLLEKMTVSGDALKSKYKGRWNILLDKLQKCLNKLIELAALRRRNYIIDQTNVFPSAQRRKLRPFEGFKRRAVVVVVGDEEQAKRQSLQEAQGSKDVPDSAVLEMKANMSLPQKGEWIDEVVYPELDETEAKALIQKYNTQGREAGFGVQKRFGHRDDRHRWQNRRNDYRGGNYRERSYHNNRYDRGPPRQGNWHPQRPGGWNRDRRDTRGPPMGGSRDWRNNRGNGRDRGNRDVQGSNYSRNRNQPGRSPGGSWQSGGNWGGQGQGGWNNQAWGGGQGSWGGQGWGSQSNQNQWKYGGGNQNYSGYSNWNYYGQYPQNWNAQGQTPAVGGTASNQYGQYSQQEWAQYAQQYAQQGQTASSTSAVTPAAPQK